jgi:hypothetical protein
MAKINLLPIELSPKSELAQLAKLMKRIAIAGSVVFLVLGLVAASFLIVMTFEADSLVKENQVLMAQIESFNQEEQSLVLVRDRVRKAKTILSERKVEPELTKVGPFLNNQPSSVIISQAELKIKESQFSFEVVDSSRLAELLSGFVTSDAFERVTLESLGF